MEARQHPEYGCSKRANEVGLEATAKTCKIFHLLHIVYWQRGNHIALTGQDKPIRLEPTKHWLKPGKPERLPKALYSDGCTIQNTKDRSSGVPFRF